MAEKIALAKRVRESSPEGKTVVLSDVHLRLDPAASNTVSLSRLTYLVDSIVSGADPLLADTRHVVLLGDLLELWSFEMSYTGPRDLHTLLAVHGGSRDDIGRLFQQFDRLIKSGIDIKYVVGNHDSPALDFEAAQQLAQPLNPGVSFLYQRMLPATAADPQYKHSFSILPLQWVSSNDSYFGHGHLFDYFNCRDPQFGTPFGSYVARADATPHAGKQAGGTFMCRMGRYWHHIAGPLAYAVFKRGNHEYFLHLLLYMAKTGATLGNLVKTLVPQGLNTSFRTFLDMVFIEGADRVSVLDVVSRYQSFETRLMTLLVSRGFTQDRAAGIVYDMFVAGITSWPDKLVGETLGHERVILGHTHLYRHADATETTPELYDTGNFCHDGQFAVMDPTQSPTSMQLFEISSGQGVATNGSVLRLTRKRLQW